MVHLDEPFGWVLVGFFNRIFPFGGGVVLDTVVQMDGSVRGFRRTVQLDSSVQGFSWMVQLEGSVGFQLES